VETIMQLSESVARGRRIAKLSEKLSARCHASTEDVAELCWDLCWHARRDAGGNEFYLSEADLTEWMQRSENFPPPIMLNGR
jgi:hypothetical protein